MAEHNDPSPTPTPAFTASAPRGALLPTVLSLGLVVLLAIAARAVRLFSHLYPPGVDAGYYPLQSRGLLENGTIPYKDLPLMFYVNAGVAKVATAVRGFDLDAATLWASKAVDAFCQPWAAVPLAMLGVGLLRRREKAANAVIVAIASACVGVLSFPILRMIGDFEKNSLGLVWMAAAACGAWRVMSDVGWRMSDGQDNRTDASGIPAHRTSRIRHPIFPALVLVVSLLLAALTHIGAFGVTVVLVAGAFGHFVMTRFSRRAVVLAAVAAAISGVALLGIVYTVAPQKAQGLVQGAGKMFTSGDRPNTRPAFSSNGPNPPREDAPASSDRPARPDGQRGAGGQRGPGGPGDFGMVLPRVGLWIIALGFCFAAWRCVRRRGADASIVVGASLVLALVSFPLLQGQYAQRLSLMAPIALVIPLAALIAAGLESTRTVARLGATGLASIITLACVASAAPLLAGGGRDGPGGQIVLDAAAPELFALRGKVPTDGSAVVLARHGLQWWAGYFLKTPVREEHATAEQLEKYTRVFILNEKPAARPTPPRRGPNDRAGDQRREPPSPMGESIPLPADAVMIHDGMYYTLHESVKSRK
ncbi:MAG: hypothetical protein K2Y21_16070 [Phycisphaerales bacterium]|nr:hypothetical protein [Phycisphaerales bacterium]